MRVKQSKSKNTINYAIIKDIKVGNKRTSTIVENLGNHNTLLKEHPDMEPLEWARLRANTHPKSILDKSIFCEQSSLGILFPNFESLFLTSK